MDSLRSTREAGKDAVDSLRGTREAEKDPSDSLRGTREAPCREVGKNHLDSLGGTREARKDQLDRGTRETRRTGLPIESRCWKGAAFGPVRGKSWGGPHGRFKMPLGAQACVRQGGAREAGKDHLDSLKGTREAGKDSLDGQPGTREVGKNHLDSLEGTLTPGRHQGGSSHRIADRIPVLEGRRILHNFQ